MKISFSDERKPEQCSRSVTWATRWFTILFDWGAMLYGRSDEFGLVILLRGWGPIFYWGRRDLHNLGESSKFNWLHFVTQHPKYRKARKYYTEQRDFVEKQFNEIAAGKRLHPVMMTATELHAQTKKATQKLKWSKTFVMAMSAPLALRALENGGYAKDPLTGAALQLTPSELARLKNVTRQNFREFNDVWADTDRLISENREMLESK
jgi:hypothetical protein